MKQRKRPVAAVVLISVVAAASISKTVHVNFTAVNFNLGNPPKAPPGDK